jgi:hypothetical protein
VVVQESICPYRGLRVPGRGSDRALPNAVSQARANWFTDSRGLEYRETLARPILKALIMSVGRMPYPSPTCQRFKRRARYRAIMSGVTSLS